MELPITLWAYMTCVNMAIGLSPFHLVFGKEALLPVEVEVPIVKLLEKSIGEVKDALNDRLLYLQ